MPYVVGAEVSHVAPGDRVAGFHLIGALAEEMVAKHWRTVVLPEAVPFATGSST